MSYAMTFLFLAKPSPAICALRRLGLGTSFAVCYSALFTKTNRIARIFNGVKDGAGAARPRFISPSSQVSRHDPPPHRHTRTDKETQVKPSSSALLQVFICLSLISVQLVMVSVWLLLEVPGTRRFTLPERRQTVILKCNVRDSSMLLSLGYDVFLVILCTVYVSLLLHASLVTALSRARFLHVRYNIYINVCPLYSCSELTCSY